MPLPDTTHDKLSKRKVLLSCCPESDFDITTKLEKLFSHNEIVSITVVKMDKPCCSELLDYVFKAVKMTHRPIPTNVTCIFTDVEEVD